MKFLIKYQYFHCFHLINNKALIIIMRFINFIFNFIIKFNFIKLYLQF